jgi:DNA repair protein SbcC/Rad50
MEILSVTLKNFKSHSDRQFTFQPGTNAICGENGAGKTSILEAIAWVLFNHRGAYKTEDLVRNGAGSAQAIVVFVSNRDDRTYEVQRCTAKGYSIYDPQLGVKLDYRHIEDEIMPWLRQQLGVAPGTDLARLFANTIGVPQGTFTADFLQAPDKRKQIFDSILKVEEYRQTNQQLLGLEKYSKAKVDHLAQTLSQYEEALLDQPLLQTRHQTLSQEIVEAESTLHQLQTQLSSLQTDKAALEVQAQQLQALTLQLGQTTAQVEAKQQSMQRLQQAVEQSQQAVQFCLANRDSYQGYLQTEARLGELEQQTKQRQQIWKRREVQQQQFMQQQQQLTRLTLQLENLTQAQVDLEALQPLIVQQESYEQQQAEVNQQLNQILLWRREQQNLTRQLDKLRSQQSQLIEAIQSSQAQQAALQQIPVLEQKRQRLQEQLSRIEAAKQFEAELRSLVTAGETQRDRYQIQAEQALTVMQQIQQNVPLLLSAPFESIVQALQAGVDLNTDLLNTLWRILADLAEQTSPQKLQQQLAQIKTQLEAADQQRVELALLENKQTQVQDWQEQIEQLTAQLAQIQQQLTNEADWQQQQQQLGQALQALGNPKGRRQLLERDLQQQVHLSDQQSALSDQHLQLQQHLNELEAELAQFSELDSEIEQQQSLRQSHQTGYRTYLEYQKAANQHGPLKTELQAAQAELQQLQAQASQLQAEVEQIAQTYDLEQYQALEARYSETRSQADQLAGGLPQQRKLLQELASQLEQLEGIAQKQERTQLEQKQAEKVRKFVVFARKVYKEAGPRITERYVQAVSREADRLFRELLNRPNVALEWTRDYEILVQEGAHSRRLINLSGGEQMCAALAVRLALLRVLADIDIAFFDEPTTNMDRPRRQSLAEAIANIKTFRQLFVISHDDTFEQVTENVILVEREG